KETKGGRRFALEGGMPDVLNQNILFLGAGAGFVSKTTHYQLKSREQAKRDSFDILTKKFRRTYGKMKEMPSNVPVALKGTTNQSLHVSYQQGMCKISFQELNNEVL
ncbi:TPA: CRISPR-associated protein Csm5, partial [Staphylococcus pseudintermedius]|nr:CRISPR-associated protein Csm5 [Staphylococcus pseudintermedius]